MYHKQIMDHNFKIDKLEVFVLKDRKALGDYAAKNTVDIVQGLVSWKSIAGFSLGLLLIFALFFIDWRVLFEKKKLTLHFHIWK